MPSYRSKYEDFESQAHGETISAYWNQSAGSEKGIVVSSARDAGSIKAGSRMAECNYYAGDLQFSSFGKAMAALYTNECFLRLWMRYDTDMRTSWSSGSGPHLLRFFHSSGGGDGWMGATTITPGWHASYILSAYGNTATEDIPALNTTWRKHEWYWNVSTGVTKRWVDGTLIYSQTLSYGGFKWDQFDFVSNTAWNLDSDADNHLYFDEIEIFTDRNDVGDGTATTGSMSDATIAAVTGSPDGGSGIVIPKFVMANRRRAA